MSSSPSHSVKAQGVGAPLAKVKGPPTQEVIMFGYDLMHYALIFGTIGFLVVMPLVIGLWIKRAMRAES